MVATKRKPAPTALDSADPRRNFTLTVDERIRAITIGAPAWSIRKRKIEDDAERLVNELVDLHDELVARGPRWRGEEGGGAIGEVFLALERAAGDFDLTKLNASIEVHNRYYPIEANLAMSQDGYLVHGKPWLPEQTYTPARLVALARQRIAERELEESD